MAQDQLAASDISHPAPARGEEKIVALAFGLMGAPLIWALHLLVNVSVAGQACAGAEPRLDATMTPGASQTFLLAVDGLACAVALAALFVSYRAWRATRRENATKQPRQSGATAAQHTTEIGEGRTRFIALGGILMSSLFLIAILFDSLAALAGPSCGK
ncbi:hypothetical protein [Methylocella tundrae]|uniref:Uncharacterized protein n=1 Tax=Methylocella tundrae TaxID=227605 RepID=A0A4U8Z7Q5_METTU|nr:hypothetical protein [Methylocella tundrae]WPP02859.1 hypothetical protein SIN04_01755 [Methylocella tundrae]VFU16471.1 conserved membrane protein of unknown function [Methylocella tundrae]